MAEKKKYASDSSTMERRIQAYPKVRNFRLFKAEKMVFMQGDSEFFNRVLDDRYRNYSQAEINNLLSIKINP